MPVMIVPDPELAPDMPLDAVPTVQLKLAEAVDVNGMLSGKPLHTLTFVWLVNAGPGLTVTVIVSDDPEHPPVWDVGVTMYCTLPGVLLLVFASVWFIVLPLPLDALLMLVGNGEIVPIVQLKLLGALAVSGKLNAPQVVAEVVAVITGVGFTVITTEAVTPGQFKTAETGVTRY